MWGTGPSDVGHRSKRCGAQVQAMWDTGPSDVGHRSERCGAQVRAMCVGHRSERCGAQVRVSIHASSFPSQLPPPSPNDRAVDVDAEDVASGLLASTRYGQYAGSCLPNPGGYVMRFLLTVSLSLSLSLLSLSLPPSLPSLSLSLFCLLFSHLLSSHTLESLHIY